jgi:TfoX/Sxy family transcriptional regulator of competence genes
MMAIDEKLTSQVRTGLADAGPLREVKMFGGIGFMLNGNMVAAVSDRGLLVRVGPDAAPEALGRKGAQPMSMNGRTMTGYIRVSGVALDQRTVTSWLRLARAFVETLPLKKAKAASKRKPKRKQSRS